MAGDFLASQEHQKYNESNVKHRGNVLAKH